jgi:hypothetical protein
MVTRGESFYAITQTLEREGIRSPRGQEQWNRPTLRNMIFWYFRSHSADRSIIKELDPYNSVASSRISSAWFSGLTSG